MKLSYAITTHNEGKCIDDLLCQLANVKTEDVEIVVMDDASTDKVTVDLLYKWKNNGTIDKLVISEFKGNFASHKNKLFELCSGDFIFQLDADELLADNLLYNVIELLDANPLIDLFYIPRINTVDGITEADIQKYGWQISEEGWIQWPDPQGRLYRNAPTLRWSGKVHERIFGATTISVLPHDPDWSIIHKKDILKQRLQNELYTTL